MDRTDAELVAAVLRGEENAFTALMRRHKSWLYLFVRRHTQTAEDAYDILQESFASAWKALSRYDPERPFEIWLRRIALNKCRDRARKEMARRRVFKVVGLGEDGPPDAPDPSPLADEAQVAGEAVGRLNLALERLPAKLKEPLVLTALEGLSQKEAADILGTNVKTVEMRVYRARKQLAAALDRSDAADLGRAG